jgi:hypothetical protein
MKMKTWVLSIAVLAMTSFILPLTSPASIALTESKLHSTVKKLIDPKNEFHIQGINVEKDKIGQVNLEINADLGSCWGKKELAREFARKTLKALFTSDLPISQVIVNVFENKNILLTVALGKNQARSVNWTKDESLDAFYGHIKSRIHYKGNPSNSCWIIENPR